MATTSTILAIALVALVAATILLLIRNSNTADIRLYFVENEWHLYHYLPRYDSMLFNLAYWHRWTILDWVEYAETKYMQEVKNG